MAVKKVHEDDLDRMRHAMANSGDVDCLRESLFLGEILGVPPIVPAVRVGGLPVGGATAETTTTDPFEALETVNEAAVPEKQEIVKMPGSRRKK